jgi:signal transduction histidine kinase
MRRYFKIILIFISLGGYCQTAEDSLLAQLDHLNEEDHNNIYYELFLLNRDTEPSKALEYARQHLAHSIKFQDSEDQAISYRILGISHMNTNEFDSALYFLEKAYSLADSLGLKLEVIKTCGQIGGCYAHLDEFKISVEYYLKFLELSKSENLPKFTAIGYNNLGLIYYRIGDFQTAKNFYLKCLKTKNYHNLTEGILLNYLNIGLCYIEIQDYSEAIIYFKKVISDCLNCNNVYINNAYYGLGKASSKMGNYSEALNYLNLSSEMSLRNSNYLLYALSNTLIAEILIKNDDYDNSIKHLDNLMGKKFDLPTRVEYKIMLLYSMIYEKQENYKKALYYKNQYIILKDSLVTDAKLSEIKNVLIDYQQSENDAILKGKEIQIRRNRQFVYMFSVLLFLLSIVLLFAYRNIKIRKKLNEKLNNLVDQRTRDFNSLLYRTSHDLAGPIASLKGLLELIGMNSNKNDIDSYLLRMKKTNKNLEDIIQKLNDVSKINSKTLKYENIDLRSNITNVIEDVNNGSCNEINLKLTGERKFRTDKLLLNIILRNILLNSLQHSDHREERHTVNVDIINNGNLVIKISDNGKGIEQKYSYKIFDLFYVATDRSNGNGLGLYQAKLAAERLRGNIKLVSTKKPITFEISIQKHKDKPIQLA